VNGSATDRAHVSACLLASNVRTQIWEGLQAGRAPESLQRMAAVSVGAVAAADAAPSVDEVQS
jgi:hypothetical protein